MKNLVFTLVLVSLLCVFPMHGNATPITLQINASSPIENIAFPNESGYYYIDYDASMNGGEFDQVFCVELDQSVTPGVLYDYFLEPLYDEYWIAAWIADNYADGTDIETGQAQLAIWEVITDDTFDLDAGDFITIGDSMDIAAQGIWTSFLSETGGIIDNITLNDNWMLATNAVAQDYLLRVPKTSVPEPSSLFLLGTGLVGIVGFRRKFRS